MNMTVLFATVLIGTGALFLLIGLALSRMASWQSKPKSRRRTRDDADQVLIL